MNNRPGPAQSRLQITATVLTASAVLMPLVLGKLFEFVIKAINPDDVNIESGLAYLLQRLIVSFSLLGTWIVVTVLVIIKLQRREGRTASRAPWIVLGVQLLLGVLLLLVERWVEGLTPA